MTSTDTQALVGGVLRSPFAHARIRRIDTRKAEAIDGVRAIVSARDFPGLEPFRQSENGQVVMTGLFRNVIAHEKVIYEGQPILAIAAEDEKTLQSALSAVDIEYAVLPHVIDVQKSMEPDAPLLHEELVTRGIKPVPSQPSNIASRVEATSGNAAEALAHADVVVADEFTTEALYPGGIALPYCQVDLLGQGRFKVCTHRDISDEQSSLIAAMLGMSKEDICFEADDGKSTVKSGKRARHQNCSTAGQSVHLEPMALMLARKSQQAVFMAMSREDAFKATGAVPGSYISMRLGADRAGRLAAAEIVICMQAGAFPGGPVQQAVDAVLASYQLPAFRVIAYDVVVNRPMVTHSQASGATGVNFALESLLDELARKLSLCPLALRKMNARESALNDPGREMTSQGVGASIAAAQSHPHFQTKLGENQGRGVSSGTALDAQGNVSCCTHICDVEVDTETGLVEILRYTAIGADKDSLAEDGGVQMAVTVGIGRALNEAYFFDENGKLKNASFRDYRLPLACDVPEITVVNSGSSQGCGSTSSMLSPLAAVANAIADATSARITSLPMSPPVVLAETQRQKWKRRLRR